MAGFHIRNDVGATVFAVLSALSTLFFTAWVFSPGGCARPKSQEISPVPLSTDESAVLETELEAAKSKLWEEAGRRAELAKELQITKGLVTSLEGEKAELLLKLEGNEGELSRLQLKLREFESAQVETKKTIADLSAKAALVTAGEADSASLKAEIEALRKKLAAVAKPAAVEKPAVDAKATADAKAALQTEIEALRKKLADAEKTGAEAKAALETEVGTLRKKLAADGKACADAKASLKAEIERLQTELDKALYGDQLKSASGDLPVLDLPFLVNDPIQLHHKIRPVFIRLRGMDDTEAELKTVYEELTKDGSTEALHRVPFASGSAYVASADTARLTELLSGTPGDAKFLVVGYASADGDAKSNYELSSRRASNVAAKLVEVAGVAKDSVQAVYFGQTRRFSASDMAPNRIVEVWRVK